MATDRSGRDTGFTEFARTAYRPLLRTARLLTGDGHAAEDLVQAALVRVYLQWGRSDSWDSPHAYARKVVVNLFATWRRRRWHGEVPDGGTAAAYEGTGAAGAASAGSTGSARDPASGVDERLALGQALSGLPRGQRAVLVLRFYEDLSVEQTAELLGCSPGTVKSRTNRALEHLRRTDALTGYAGRTARRGAAREGTTP